MDMTKFEKIIQEACIKAVEQMGSAVKGMSCFLPNWATHIPPQSNRDKAGIHLDAMAASHQAGYGGYRRRLYRSKGEKLAANSSSWVSVQPAEEPQSQTAVAAGEN